MHNLVVCIEDNVGDWEEAMLIAEVLSVERQSK
jgi:hypothetical protein